MKKYSFVINGNKYEVEIGDTENNRVEVSVNGIPYKVEIDRTVSLPKTPKLVQSPSIPSTDVTPQTKKTVPPGQGGVIKSPLPGIILDIHVKENEQISHGQKLVTIEAMKMENVIFADKEGTVKSIKVKKGDNILEGAVLIELM